MRIDHFATCDLIRPEWLISLELGGNAAIADDTSYWSSNIEEKGITNTEPLPGRFEMRPQTPDLSLDADKSDPVSLDISPANGGMRGNQGGCIQKR